MGEINHCSHEHPLTPCNDFFSSDKCYGCKHRISGPAFCCSENCGYIIDRWCAELQYATTHPLHDHPQHTLIFQHNRRGWECHACGCSSDGFFLYCSFPGCEFQLDAVCAGLTPKKDHQGRHEHKIRCISPKRFRNHGIPDLQIQTHPLMLCDLNRNFDRSCSACKLPFEDSIYVCLECKLLLHKSCSEFPLQFRHHFHPNHTLNLLSKAYNYGRLFADDKKCDACGHREMRVFYSCFECPFDLDIVCASLTLTTNPPEDHEHLIQHLGQNHPLIICDMKNKFNPSCSVCLLPFEDSMMIYVCLECKILLHKSCLELPIEIKNHPLHPGSSLILSTRPTYWKFTGFCECHVCRESINYGCLYDAEHGPIFKIHAKCASPKPTIMSNVHDHPLVFIEKGSFGKAVCDTCRSYIDTAFFRCVTCDITKYSIHVRCHPTLPHTIKIEYHLHPLTIKNSPVTNRPDENEDSELYCDACEGRRYLHHPTYYCEQCDFVAHVDCNCVIYEVLRVLEKERSKACKTGDTKSDTLTDAVEDAKLDTLTKRSKACKTTEMEITELDSDACISEDGLAREAENFELVEPNGERAKLYQKAPVELDEEIVLQLKKVKAQREKIKIAKQKFEAQKEELEIGLQNLKALKLERSNVLLTPKSDVTRGCHFGSDMYRNQYIRGKRNRSKKPYSWNWKYDDSKGL